MHPAARRTTAHGRFPAAVLSASLLACALLGGCADLPPAPPPPPAGFPTSSPADRGPFVVGVLTASWHTGLIVPASELGPLRERLPAAARARYLSFGWGSRRFYMAAHPGSGDALAALFRSPSVLFVQAASTPEDLLPEDARLRWLCLDRAEVWRLDRYLEDTLQRRGGRLRDLGNGPLPDSRFYASTGRYSALHTCNTWTVAALQYAGLAVHARGVIFATQVAARTRRPAACPAR